MCTHIYIYTYIHTQHSTTHSYRISHKEDRLSKKMPNVKKCSRLVFCLIIPITKDPHTRTQFIYNTHAYIHSNIYIYMYINKACARACVSLASQTPEKTVFIYNVERERHTCAHLYTLPTPHTTLCPSPTSMQSTRIHIHKNTQRCAYIYVHMYVCVVFCSTLRIWHARG